MDYNFQLELRCASFQKLLAEKEILWLTVLPRNSTVTIKYGSYMFVFI